MDKLESMVLEAETVSALMIHLADDDVGDTSFAVMSDLGENGTEHECDLGVHETALRASAVIDALLAELEASKQYAKERDAENESLALTVGRLRAKLATQVRLPELCGDGENDNEYTEGLNDGINQSAKAIRAAGFTVEGDEQ